MNLQKTLSRQNLLVRLLLSVVLGATLVVFLSGCNDSIRLTLPRVPDPRPPALEELYGETYSMTWLIDGHPWRGEVEIELLPPDIGLDGFPAEIVFSSGFDGARECLEVGRGVWEYDGGFLEATFTSDDGTVVVIEGNLERHFKANPDATTPAGTRVEGVPQIIHEDRGAGGWGVVRGAACEEDDFSFGNTGRWTIGEGVIVTPSTGEIQGDLARVTTLLVLDADGEIALHAVEEVRVR